MMVKVLEEVYLCPGNQSVLEFHGENGLDITTQRIIVRNIRGTHVR